MLTKVETSELSLALYREWLDWKTLYELERLADRFGGLKVGQINATSRGGGVADILRSLVPLMNGLGLKTDWYCISSNGDFSRVTKNIHNSLRDGSWQFDCTTQASC